VGRKDQGTSETNSGSANEAKMGVVLWQRTHHLQLGTVTSTMPVSRIRYRARTSPPQNSKSREVLQKFVIGPSARVENGRAALGFFD